MTAQANGGPLGPAPPAHRSSRATILLVDDDNKVRRDVRRALEAEGYRVIEARTGSQALRMCEYVPGGIDLLLAEVTIPEPNGVMLAEAVREWWPKAAVVLISDDVIAAVSCWLGKAKVHQVLGRPQRVDEFVETARRALVGR